MRALHKIGVNPERIKWEHSIFALPFALTAAMSAASGWARLYQVLRIRDEIFRGCSSCSSWCSSSTFALALSKAFLPAEVIL
jgi:hypothetical protein